MDTHIISVFSAITVWLFCLFVYMHCYDLSLLLTSTLIPRGFKGHENHFMACQALESSLEQDTTTFQDLAGNYEGDH